VAFFSSANNLIPDDTNNNIDVFVHDFENGLTTRVSGPDGVFPLGVKSTPYGASISSDGQYVAFPSYANTLVMTDTNNEADIFVYDKPTETYERVSIASDGTEASSWSISPALSADGRYVAFASIADNLITGDGNYSIDVFVHDRITRETSRVSQASDGTPGNYGSQCPSISSDGNSIAFRSFANTLVLGDTNDQEDVFVRKVNSQETIRVSANSVGVQGNNDSDCPSISGDGQLIAFSSFASNLVISDTNNFSDVFIHDLATGETDQVSVSSDGTQGNGNSLNPKISANGQYITFESYATDLIAGDTNNYCGVNFLDNCKDIFVRDLMTSQTFRVSITHVGSEANGISLSPSISGDGNVVVFQSEASNLVSGDTNAQDDIFAYAVAASYIYLPLVQR